MPKESAGILLYRRRSGRLEFLLVHPGGPFWTKHDTGAWSIPKGEIHEGEPPLEAARREFCEELGTAAPPTQAFELLPVTQKGGKTIHAWACEGDFDPATLSSNTFQCEWPPRSGKLQQFPEVDRAEWFSLPDAKEKVNAAQIPLLEQVQSRLDH